MKSSRGQNSAPKKARWTRAQKLEAQRAQVRKDVRGRSGAPARGASPDRGQDSRREDNRGGFRGRDDRRDDNRGGYQRRDDRGGYDRRDDNRGGFRGRDDRRDDNRGGYQRRDDRGGYDRREDNRGGFRGRDDRRDDNRGGFRGRDDRRDDNRGSYQRRDDNRGGYDRRDDNRGGFRGRDDRRDDSRGGYQRRDDNRGGFRGRDDRRDDNRGGYQRRDDNRGGFRGRDDRRDDNRGGYQRRDDNRGGFRGRDDRRDDSRGGYQRRDDRGGSMHRGPGDRRGFAGNSGRRDERGYDRRDDRGGYGRREDRRDDHRGGFQRRDDRRDDRRQDRREAAGEDVTVPAVDRTAQHEAPQQQPADVHPEAVQQVETVDATTPDTGDQPQAGADEMVTEAPVEDASTVQDSNDTDSDDANADENTGEQVSFADLGLPEVLVERMARDGITSPFPIQVATIPDALAGRDVLGRGRTGSGKTLSFGLPTISRLAAGGRARAQQPRAVILAPTRELAMQVHDALTPLVHVAGLKHKLVAGGMPYEPQLQALERGVDLLVATPGRLQDLMERGAADLSRVEIMILDEADHMAEMGFLEAITEILDATPADGQRLLFSATLDRGIDTIVEKYLKDPVIHSTDDGTASVTTMEHHALLIDPQDKKVVTAEVANRDGRTVVFVRTKLGADRVAGELRDQGVMAAALHGGLNQGQRNKVLAAFKDGRVPVLVATDVAARGIHVDDVGVVLQVDPPADHKDYLHRSGRTARAGESGTVVTLALPHQRRTVQRLLDQAGVETTLQRAKPGDQVIAAAGGSTPTGGRVTDDDLYDALRPPRSGRGGRPGGRGGYRSGGRGFGGDRGGDRRGGFRGGRDGGDRRGGFRGDRDRDGGGYGGGRSGGRRFGDDRPSDRGGYRDGGQRRDRDGGERRGFGGRDGRDPGPRRPRGFEGRGRDNA